MTVEYPKRDHGLKWPDTARFRTVDGYVFDVAVDGEGLAIYLVGKPRTGTQELLISPRADNAIRVHYGRRHQ